MLSIFIIKSGAAWQDCAARNLYPLAGVCYSKTDTEGTAMVWYDMIYAIAMRLISHKQCPSIDASPEECLIRALTQRQAAT